MSYLLSLLAPFRWSPGHDCAHIDDDLVDRFHHRYTTILFVFFCLLISSTQYVGDPLHCWAPGHFTNNYRQYTNKICWVSNTYYLPLGEAIPASTPKEQIGYYQWVPMFLLAQALFFHLPYLFWSIMNSKSGIDLSAIIAAARTIQSCPTKPQTANDRQKTMRFMFRQMDRYVGHFRPESQGCCPKLKTKLANKYNLVCGKKYGNFIVCLYLVTKCLYLLNAVVQFFILDSFLSTDFHMYGALVIRGMITKEDWPAARIFPRTTMCDFTVRALGNTHRHTVQCVLSINFFNEKIYVIVWFWLVLLCAVTAVSLALWVTRMVFRTDQFRYVKRHLCSMDTLHGGRKPDDKMIRRFVVEYLRQDGVLVLRLLNSNVNSIIVAEFVVDLWEHFLARSRLARKNNSGSEIDIV